jgi:hypothetical protein
LDISLVLKLQWSRVKLGLTLRSSRRRKKKKDKKEEEEGLLLCGGGEVNITAVDVLR